MPNYADTVKNHDADGRFAGGNKAAKRSRRSSLQVKLDLAVQESIEKQIDLAHNGDSVAQRWLADRYGKGF